MQQYALIFQLTRQLTTEEQQQRPADIAAWVRKVSDMGIILDPRNFGETLACFAVKDGHLISGKGPNSAKPATIVFVDSASREQAVEIARIHPGLRYGVTVDVREWTSPRRGAGVPLESDASLTR